MLAVPRKTKRAPRRRHAKANRPPRIEAQWLTRQFEEPSCVLCCFRQAIAYVHHVVVSITRRVRSRITRSTDVGGCRPATGRRSLLLPYAVASVGSHKLAAAVTRGHTMRRRPRCPDRSIDRCEVVVRARRTILIAPFDRRHGPAGLPAASPPRRRRPK